jgi:hypothetical protein
MDTIICQIKYFKNSEVLFNRLEHVCQFDYLQDFRGTRNQ